MFRILNVLVALVSFVASMVLPATLIHAQVKPPAVEWTESYGGSSWEGAYAVQQTKDGGYIVAGRTMSDGRSSEVCLIKLDPKGSLDPAWSPNPKTFGRSSGPSSWDAAYAVQQTTDGGYILAGYTRSYVAGGGADVYLIKLDPKGNLDPAWSQNPKSIGSPGGDEKGYAVQQTKDGGYIVAGHRSPYPDIWYFYLIKLSP